MRVAVNWRAVLPVLGVVAAALTAQVAVVTFALGELPPLAALLLAGPYWVALAAILAALVAAEDFARVWAAVRRRSPPNAANAAGPQCREAPNPRLDA